MTRPLAELLLRRKELVDKVTQLHAIRTNVVLEEKVVRKAITDSIDEIRMTIPKVTMSALTKEYDFYAKNLRLIDAIIQRTNWNVEVEVEPKIFDQYETPKEAA